MAKVVSNTGNPLVDRYLVDGEVVVALVRRHWVVIAEPVATAVASLIAVVTIGAFLPREAAVVSDILFWLWFIVLGRTLWMVLEWRRNWFVATDRRLLLTYGFIIRKVAMMPFRKMTDMHYSRSVPGRVLGYGRFVLESAGKDQVLREINYVPHPDETYRAICGEMFGKSENPARKGDKPAEGGMPGAAPAPEPAPARGGLRGLLTSTRAERERRRLLALTGGEDYSRPFREPEAERSAGQDRGHTDWTTDPDEDLDLAEVDAWRESQGFEGDDGAEVAADRPLAENGDEWEEPPPPPRRRRRRRPAVYAPTGGLGGDDVEPLVVEEGPPAWEPTPAPREVSVDDDPTGDIPLVRENGVPGDDLPPWPDELGDDAGPEPHDPIDTGWAVSREDAAPFTRVIPAARRDA